MQNYKFATKAIHAGSKPDKLTGALMPAIYPSSTFAQSAPGEPIGEFEYSRSANPTRSRLEENLATLENAKHGLAFGSGCAALSTLLHLLEPNSHVLVNDDVYGGTFRIFNNIFEKLNISFTQADFSDLSNIENNLRNNTKLIWLETPSNPLLKIADIKKISEIKNKIDKNIIFCVDNTFATPYLQNPLGLGADLVCHSATKYLGGHSDLVAGALITNSDLLNEKLRYLQNAIGAILSPFDSYLLLRSTKTLAIRMQNHCQNAKQVAEFLTNHSKISKVIYPGFKSHPGFDIAKEQMRDFGGMVSFEHKGSLSEIKQFLGRLKIITLAESLGGVESLIEHPAIMTHASVDQNLREKIGITDGLVRLSCGIEDIDDLIFDLNQAL